VSAESGGHRPPLQENDQNLTHYRQFLTGSSDGSLSFYVEQKIVKGFYKVSFRVPGANTGVP
jgi:hypothetical protein